MSSYYNLYEEYGLKHYQIPKVFFTNEQYRKMDNDAKMLWAILRDRFSLSSKNGWYDDLGNIYFIFTNEELMELLGVAKAKLQKVKKQLIDNGLLEQKRMGLNVPNRLYLKKPVVTEQDIYLIENQEKEPSNPYGSTEVRKSNFKKFENQTSRSSKIKH